VFCCSLKNVMYVLFYGNFLRIFLSYSVIVKCNQHCKEIPFEGKEEEKNVFPTAKSKSFF